MTLSSHLDINLQEFGSTLWHSIVLPALTCGCAVWFEDKKYLEDLISSMQYKCARSILKLKCTPAKLVMFSDLR